MLHTTMHYHLCWLEAGSEAAAGEQQLQLLRILNMTMKDRTGRIWSTNPPAVHRRQVQDIVKQRKSDGSISQEKPIEKQTDATMDSC